MGSTKCVMVTIGIVHIINGVLLPILWGVGFIFPTYVSTIAAPVWAGIVFFIPSGILGIIASGGKSRGAAAACATFNGLGFGASLAVIIFGAIVTSADFTGLGYYYYADVAIDIIICILAGFELVLSVVAGVFAKRMARPAPPLQTTMVYSGGVVNAGMYPPGTQGQAQPVTGQYPDPPSQGQYPPPQGQYPPPQGQYPPPQGQYPQPQGQYPQPQGQYPPP